MLHKTKGIVLNYMKYKETSIIARIYTSDFGLQSYIINGVRSNRSKKGLALLQPLTLLDMVVYVGKNTGEKETLHRISEYKSAYTLSDIPFNIKKSSIALFVTELLSKVLREEDERGKVFEFLSHFVVILDELKEGFESIHIYLMVHMTHFIGFGIQGKEELERENILIRVNSNYPLIYETIVRLNAAELSDDIRVHQSVRKDCLEFMVRYYQLHLEGFKELKSQAILTQIFN